MALYEINALDGAFGQYSATVDSTETTISAGDFVVPVGTTNEIAIAATSTSYYKTTATANILVKQADSSADESRVCGMALDTKTYSALTGVDNTITIGTRGVFVVRTNAAVTVGQGICLMANCGTQNYVTPAESGGRVIGLALTPADTQGEYIVLLMNISGHIGAAA